MKTLVICYGNKSRGDDGAGRLVGEILAERLPEGVALLNEPQLDVVMAEDIAHARTVVFVDAERRESPAVTVDNVTPGTAGTHAHSVDPPGLLSLAETLYSRAPRALLVSIAAPEMGHAEGLTNTARAASEEAARVVLELVADAC